MSSYRLQSRECAFCQELDLSPSSRVHGSAAALHDRFPVSPGHTLIVPRRHVADLFQLSDDELRDVWHLVKTVREELLGEDSTIAGFNIGVNSGAVAGQTIPHAHVHIIPRRSGDTADPRGGVRGVIPHQMVY
jgi:ATP adenylyltransferase